MEKEFCFECGIAIKRPGFLVMDSSDSAVEFKKGWKCAACARKR